MILRSARKATHRVFIVSLLLLPVQASGQLYINEVLENPPGHSFSESSWEYIELYGMPEMPLDGFAIVVFKGGVDDDRNGIPEIEPHVDEVFFLDGMETDSTGLALIFNTSQDHNAIGIESIVGQHSPHARSFQSCAPGSRVGPMRLDHDGSSTYMLVRGFDRALADSVLSPGSEHDTNFDGKIDCFFPHNGDTALPRFQIVDVLSWSNRGGKEYGWLDGYELSETHGINPDALSRVAFFDAPPRLGSYTKDVRDSAGRVTGFKVLDTSIADESCVYGVLDSATFPETMVYFTGSDLEGWSQTKAPTDQMAMPIVLTGEDPEPDSDPFPSPMRRSFNGDVLTTDLGVEAFRLTPGSLNDHPSGTITQERIVRGDLNCNGGVDRDDLEVARILVGTSIDDRYAATEGSSEFRWHGAALQRLIRLVELSDDESGLDRSVSPQDLEMLESLAH